MMRKQLRYCKILNTNISVTNMEETVDYLTDNLEELKGNYICVSNVHTTMMSFRDKAYNVVQNSGAMALPDGKPLAIVCRLRKFYDAGRVPGPDLMPRIFQVSREKGYRHYFYGGSEETIDKLRAELKRQYPWLKIVGMYSPPYRTLTKEEDEEIVRKINEAKPDFIWVALGAPKQEIWMYEHQFKVCGLMLGVGAAFDFCAGTVKRAPGWVQELCLEWLYRLIQDPRRLFTRYLTTNASFLFHVIKENHVYRKENKYKKVAMIGHKRIPSREGGVEIVVDEISTRLTERGYHVEAYNRSGYHVSGKEFDEKRGKIYNGIRLITIPTFKSSSLNAIVYSFLATIRALFGGYGVIHFHAEGPCIMLGIPKFFGKRTIATIHGLDWQRSKWGNFASKMLQYGEKQAAKRADAVIVLSRNVQEYFRETYHRETIYIPNGIEEPEKRKCDIINEKYGLEGEDYILFLARLVPEKGVHYLIDAYKQLKTDKKLVIAGGNSHAAEYRAQIYQEVKSDANIIMTGFVQGRELEELYSNAYLFALPSDVEGMALSLLEAMSYGNCCVVSDIPENMEVVEDKAVCFKKSDSNDLREKLSFLLAHPEEVQKYKEDSAPFICSKYNWDDVVDKTIQVYSKGELNGQKQD
ncbi:WecB/TagA/CpsF family glycosyltransferase [Lachnospiraceae bacterium 64-25]|jgi:exopolysaccharide biosynthesis WecB/TagA/CpsF family protein